MVVGEMNKELEQRINSESDLMIENDGLSTYLRPDEIVMVKSWRLDGATSDAMLDYVIERAVVLAREDFKGFDGNMNSIIIFRNTINEIKSIIKGELKASDE